ncbi:MAG: SDR family NAD(P)-dependent oxidoreductase, partial [Gemmatimonadaceae bacterium]|nr:SDR family NAD(P)-dependent oxidoreductase [Gemmatimonadaceae bacterium]
MQFAVVTPPISLDPSLAIAASRSGALGILNLELARTENAARDAVNRLAQFGRGRLGIRIDVADLPLIKGVLGALPAAIGDVIIAGATGITAPSIIAEMREQGRRVWLEVGSAELADVGVTWGVDALLAKGNEPGGWIGEDSALVLLQQLVARFEIPVFAQGGIGLRTAAACAAGGAAGVVLGEQLALARESTLPLAVKTAIGKLDENETVCLGTELGLRYRVYARAGHRSVAQLEELAASLGSDESAEKNASAWREAVRRRTGWSESGDQVWPIGQDAVFARDLAERYRTVGGVLAAFQDEFESHLRGESRDKARAHVAVRKQTALPARPYRIAIVGMSCILPKAGNLAAYWDNILNKVCGITEVPPDRWDQTLYYDPDPSARDKMNSKWGGFLDPVAFDPTEFGMPPGAVASTDPMQLLALNSARAALKDAGYHKRPFDRGKTAVILGISGGLGNLGIGYTARSAFPHLFGGGAEEQLDRTEGRLPEWTKDSFAGLLPNVTAGRISNRLDLGGTNYIIDAACASSMTAVYLAANELESGSADLAIAGGVDVLQNPQTFMSFSKTHALSPTGQLKAFDANADGVVISDGVVMLVLKRLDDAERDGDRIYAVIQGVGGSSDGKAKGLTAPRPEGQAAAIRRAYEKAGVSPATVGLFEAHGTGTVVGDRAEALALSTVLEEAGGKGGAHAIGSVKSMIGHTKGAAGAAGLAKAALALYHKTLPPTMGVTDPNPRSRFGKGPLYVNSELRPWIHSSTVHPRRAAVSAFGFGGTNFHAVVEEYRGEFLPPESVSSTWPSELLLWVGESAANIATQVAELEAAFAQGARPELASLAFTLAERYHAADATALHTLAVVACSLEDLQSKLDVARLALANDTPLSDPRGIYYNAATPDAESRIAVLFPGQGSQYTDMLRELAVYFGELREAFERADTVLADRMKGPLSAYVFPIPAFVDEDRAAQQQALTQTDIAQPALAVAGAALFSLLSELGVRAQWAAGHSFGEYVALHAGGVFDFDTLLRLAHERGRSIVESAGDDLGTMAAISAGEEHVARVVLEVSDVCIANINAPAQTIISGTRAGIERALELLRGEGLQARSLPVACAFHSPLVAPAQTRLAEALADIELRVPTLQVLSNTTAKPYPSDPALIRNLLAEHLAKPVRFMDQVLAMHDAGARIFLEVGPRAVLTGLTRQILRDRDHVAIALDAPGRSGVTQLQLALAQLAANGVKLQLGRLFRHRPVSAVDIANLATARLVQTPSANVWMVDGWRARPIHAPLLVRPVAHTAPAARETSATPGGRDSAVVLEDFDRLMQRFLEGQRSAVDTFLHAAREPGIRGQKNAEPQPSERRDPVPDEDPARFRLVAVETPVAIAGALPAFDRVLVITDDGCGIAAAVASRVRRAGGRAVLIREGGEVAELSSEVFQFDPADPNHAVQVLRLVRQRNGPIGGILHLMPLRRTFASDTALRWNAASADLAVWRDVVRRDVKSAFHLARAALDDLALPGSAQTIVMTATALQRNWGASLNAEIGSAQQTAGCPAHAGLIGLLNTLALEVPAVRCRAVDLDPADTVEAMADRIMSELGILVGPAQVGYRGSRRYTAVPVSATLPVSTVREVSPLGPESVVLVTGGGRGITAAVAVALAQLYQPTLVLAGRSPLTADETPATLACRSPAEISSVLIAERQRDGKPVVLAEVSADAQRIINEREIRATLARVRATGSRVRYEKIDVRDADALLALVRRIEAEHGRLDGVIHGAGVIEDRRIGQKEPESFDRVFDTKADSAFVLSQVLDPERTKFLVFFSSAASVFGNPGQADYAAANAVLNALAVDLDSRWPGRVVAIGWGPWGDTGMVSDGVRRELASRGIDVMSAAAGCRAL